MVITPFQLGKERDRCGAPSSFVRPEHQSIKQHASVEAETTSRSTCWENEASALEASRYSIGHIAIGVALSYIDFRFPELGMANDHPGLTAWHGTFATRPAAARE